MDVIMPQLGETVTEGKITTWFKQVGDRSQRATTLFEVETDKASMDVEAIGAGRLSAIHVEAGGAALVGVVVAVIADAAAAVPRRLPPPPRLDPFREVRTPERNYGRAKGPNGVAVTPLARRLAATAGLDLAQVVGRGTRGRITRRDVEALLRQGDRDAPPAPAPEPAAARDVAAAYRDRPYQEIPLDRMRRTIARRLTEAVQTIPHFHLTTDVAVERLLALREQANAAVQQGIGGTAAEKISINDFVLKAFALALQAVPTTNAIWADDRILQFRHSDIGMAVATEGGLMTPVLHDVESKSILAIAAEARKLVERARARRLQPQETEGGAAAVTNLGVYGVREFSAIINPPHATILAVGAVQQCPVETEAGGVTFASRMTVTLTCDHRVIDGAVGASLLAAFKQIVELPMRIVL